jgi:hypothetical protein
MSEGYWAELVRSAKAATVTILLISSGVLMLEYIAKKLRLMFAPTPPLTKVGPPSIFEWLFFGGFSFVTMCQAMYAVVRLDDHNMIMIDPGFMGWWCCICWVILRFSRVY